MRRQRMNAETWRALTANMRISNTHHVRDRSRKRGFTSAEVSSVVFHPHVIEEEFRPMNPGQIRAFRLGRGRYRCWVCFDSNGWIVVKSMVNDRPHYK